MKATAKEIALARNLYQDPEGDIEIDDDAEVSVAEESRGKWVAAWVWVADEDEVRHVES
jgi:hypothetical protein